MTSIPQTNIYFIDKNVRVSKGLSGGVGSSANSFTFRGRERVIREPIITLLKVIITSPLLSCCKRGPQILQEALNQARARIGEAKTLVVAEDCIKGILRFKGILRIKAQISFRYTQEFSILEYEANEESKKSALLAALDLSNSDQSLSPGLLYPNSITVIESDKNSLAFHFLVATYKIALKSESKSLPSAVIEKLKKSVASDIQTLRYFAHALILSPLDISICFHLHHMQHESVTSEAAAASSTAATATTGRETTSLYDIKWWKGENLRSDLLATSSLYSHTNSPDLFEILTFTIKDSVGRILLLDDDLAVVYSLVAKWPSVLIPLLCKEIISCVENLSVGCSAPVKCTDANNIIQTYNKEGKLIEFFTSSLEEILSWPITYLYLSESILCEALEALKNRKLGGGRERDGGDTDNCRGQAVKRFRSC